MLAGFAVIGLGTRIPPAAAQPAAVPDSFMALSQLLTGRTTLDPRHAALLYQGLLLIDPGLDARTAQLLTFMRDRNAGPEGVQAALEASAPDLAPLPRQIVRAWYTGVVGEGPGALCLTFESSLMHQAVSDRLSPPSLCYGAPGSWSMPPGQGS